MSYKIDIAFHLPLIDVVWIVEVAVENAIFKPRDEYSNVVYKIHVIIKFFYEIITEYFLLFEVMFRKYTWMVTKSFRPFSYLLRQFTSCLPD